MYEFVFYNPTRIVFGEGSIKETGPVIRDYGNKKVAMIAGGGSIKKNGVYDQVTASLEKNGIDRIECWGVRPNPVLSTVREMIRSAKENDIDAVLAVGGGSVIDTAKSVAAGVFMDDIWDAYENGAEITRALPVYTVLTLSAAGSEMDQFAVLTNEDKKRKWNIISEYIYPRVSIIDPAVQVSLPWHQTVNGAIDALSHIMEFYFMGEDQETTMAVDEALMRTIIGTVDKLKKDPSDHVLRADLAWACTLALNGISGAGMRGGDWASHWIEHGLSALYPDIAHGAGLSIIFPAWIKNLNKKNTRTFERWARNIWGAGDVESGISAMKDKYVSWGSPVYLKDVGIKEQDLCSIVDKVLEAGKPGGVKELGRDDLTDILQTALG